jgi:hypothetical protein
MIITERGDERDAETSENTHCLMFSCDCISIHYRMVFDRLGHVNVFMFYN